VDAARLALPISKTVVKGKRGAMAFAARVRCSGVSATRLARRLEHHGSRTWCESVHWCGWWHAWTVEGRRVPCKAHATLLCFCSSLKKKQRGR
jgi:hypothetical protein